MLSPWKVAGFVACSVAAAQGGVLLDVWAWTVASLLVGALIMSLGLLAVQMMRR